MNKGTIGFGFRSPLEYTCLTSDFNIDNLTEIQEIIQKTMNKPATFNTPFERNQFGSKNTLVMGRIEKLDGRYITPDEQELLRSEFKAHGFKVKDIS